MSVRQRVGASFERGIAVVAGPRDSVEKAPVTEPCRDLLGGAWP